MVDATHISFPASDRSYYAILKKEIHNRTLEAGFELQKISELDIIVAELTSNLHKYARNGEILFGIFGKEEDCYVELICIDDGPGMTDPAKMMADGFSSTNTIGHGFGSIKRMSDVFEVYSIRDWGTIVLSRIYKKARTKNSLKPKVDIKGIVVPKPNERTSGDGYYYKLTDKYFKLLVADGLGHGPEANLAINEAVKAFKLCAEESPVQYIRFIHSTVRKTRGLVGTVVIYDFEKRVWKIAGVGNIATKFYNATEFKNQMAYNGIIGHNIPNTMNDQELSSGLYQQIILCSDGIRSRWDLSKYTGINRYDLTILAAALFKDFARRTDDMSVIICKVQQR